MSELEIILISLGLSMDAFAVSVTSGITINKMKIKHAMLIATFIGFFQGAMPLLGWLLGHFARDYIVEIDHWIAFILLAVIGGKMIYEALQDDDENDDNKKNPLNIYILFLLSIATSIDALAVGLTLSFLDISIMHPVLVIGLITFVMSFIGAYIGKMFGHLFEKKLEIFGGIVLIGIGLKILIEHTMFQ